MGKLKSARYLRKCGHPNDAVSFMVNIDYTVNVYCTGCLMERSGLKPVERLSPEEFKRKYMMVE